MASRLPLPARGSRFMPWRGRAACPGVVVRVEAWPSDAVEVTLHGSVQGQDVARLAQVLADLRTQGRQRVEVDLTRVAFLSRDAVWALFADARQHPGTGGLRLRGASGQPEYILHQTGLARVLE